MRTWLLLVLCLVILGELVAQTESLPFVFRYFASGPDNPLAKKKKANPACKKPTEKPSIVSVPHVENSNHQEQPDDDDDGGQPPDENVAVQVVVPTSLNQL